MKKLGIVFLLIIGVRAGAQPAISSLSALTGIPGNTVTITGTGFNTTPGNDVVYFGATRATVTTASATALTVTVPTDATYAPVSVNNTASGLTGYSDHPFLPTYDNSGYMPDTVNFDPKVSFPTGFNPNWIVLGDLDGDGKTDMVVVNLGDSSVYVYRNTSSSGSVTFAPAMRYVTGFAAFEATIGDIDGDGKPDLAVVNAQENNVSILRNTSSTGSISFAPKIDFTTNNGPQEVLIADVDGDGLPELVIANYAANNISVLRNISVAGTVNFAPQVVFTAGNGIWTIAMDDMDGDGKIDMVSSNATDNTVSVLRNTATTGVINTSSFAPQVTFPTGNNPFCVLLSDIDGDTKPDIVVVNSVDHTASVLRNTSSSGSITTGSFAPQVVFTPGSGPQWMAIGDMDGDGKPDITCLNDGDNTISVLRNMSTSGSIDASSFVPVLNYSFGNVPFYSAIGDIDGDGLPDLVVTNNIDTTINVLRNHPLPAATTQIKTNLLVAEIRLVPNPNNGTFSISGTIGPNNDQVVHLEITDMLGQVVYRNTAFATGGVTNVDVLLNNALANGMYLLNVKSGGGSKTLHFVIEK